MSIQKKMKSILANSVDNLCIKRFFSNPCSLPFVKTYWYCNWQNFGDLLMPAILMRYGIMPLYAPANRADLIGIGTHFHYINPKCGSIIWGTGIKNMSDFIDLSDMTVLCLRGYKTLERTKISKNANPIICDPGMVCSDLMFQDRTIEKKYRLGVVLHFQDDNYTAISDWAKSNPEITFIDIRSQPNDFISYVCECEFIMTSSLHGACAAESLHIPYVLLAPPSSQGKTKYEDFYSAFGVKPEYSNFDSSMTVASLRNEAHCIEMNIVNEKKKLLRESISVIKEKFNGGGGTIV